MAVDKVTGFSVISDTCTHAYVLRNLREPILVEYIDANALMFAVLWVNVCLQCRLQLDTIAPS